MAASESGPHRGTPTAMGWPSPSTRTTTWYPPPPPATVAALSGRQVLTAIADGVIAPPPMASLVGAELVVVGDGSVTFEWSPEEAMYNPAGVVHGGLLCTLLDFAAAAAVQTLLSAGATLSSAEIKVSYLRPVTVATGRLSVRGSVLRLGSTTGFAEARAADTAGTLVAHATSTIAVRRPQTEPDRGP